MPASNNVARLWYGFMLCVSVTYYHILCLSSLPFVDICMSLHLAVLIFHFLISCVLASALYSLSYHNIYGNVVPALLLARKLINLHRVYL